jgi:hypothetical protein
MEKAYKDLDIQFLPDNIVDELNQQKLTLDTSLSSTHVNLASLMVDLNGSENHTDSFLTNFLHFFG